MGCWTVALGRLKIEPEPTADMIKEYLFFSEYSCPDDFRKDEVFSNPWFFDKNLNPFSFSIYYHLFQGSFLNRKSGTNS